MNKEYKTPKVLEKRPLIGGFDLSGIVMLTVTLLLFIFTVFKSFLVSLLFPMGAITYIKIKKKYPQKGQIKIMLKYISDIQCIRIDQPIRELIKKN
ncbi:hypothetical protein V1387_17995 [Allomuricauda taeanensis]|uniref:hypothetical protein n=1 Tax=Flagellimonas taeanensis TaxID=1005926 RepID=UPI002E7BF9A5|nr:hypothetical protein [Allomuricauda taeanensis]MEE1964585.1 hypothetical protein [Allomuricauda taeanensis]